MDCFDGYRGSGKYSLFAFKIIPNELFVFNCIRFPIAGFDCNKEVRAQNCVDVSPKVLIQSNPSLHPVITQTFYDLPKHLF